MRGANKMGNWKYTAFISYRHGGNDEFAAKTLHNMLENYRVPAKLAAKLGRKKVGRIFRDVDELPSSSSLYNNIEEALGQSEFLIVICTPRLQESKWCMREIELFQKLRGSDHIIAVLAEGEPVDSFPYAITHPVINGQEVEVEPLAADVRGETPAKQKHKMRVEQLRIVAAMLHCEFDQLRQREQQRQLQRGIAAGGVSFAVVCAFLAMSVRENQKLQKQVQKTQSAQSYLLAEYSDTAYSADNLKLAAMLAMEGLPEDLGDDRPFEGAAMASLTNALQTYDYQKGYAARSNVKTQTMDAVLVSPYDDYIAYIDLVSSSDYTLHFYDIAAGKVVADFPVNPDYNGYRSCNSKAAFFGDHRCAIAGKEGLQVIDMNTMEVLWEGAYGMTVSASADGSRVSVFNIEENSLTVYTADGTLLSECSWENGEAVFFGMSDDGRYAAVAEVVDEDNNEQNNLYIINTNTGNTVKYLDDVKYENCVFNDSSWCGNKLFFTYGGDELYGYVDMDQNQVHKTTSKIETDICYADSRRGLIYFRDGNQLNCASMETGEVEKTYSAARNIADVVYTGDGKKNTTFAVSDSDGTLEYVDFTKDPYRIGSLAGDGKECSEICIGDTYAVTYTYNDYEFRIYQKNNRSTSQTASMKKRSNEKVAHLIRRERMLAVNCTDNSYMVNLSTMKGTEFANEVSYMNVINDNLVSCDNLDGTISVYDGETGELLTDLPDGVGGNLETDAAYMVEDGVMKKYSYDKTDKSADEVEPVYTEEVPEDCIMAFISKDGYLVEERNDGGDTSTLVVLDPDRKEVLSVEETGASSSGEADYVLYQPAGETDYVLYNFAEKKEIARMDLGEFSWMECVNGGYAFLCSSDKGAYIVDTSTGEVILTISEANTLYTFDAPEGQPYFTALYLSDNGETRLDVYSREEPSSPIARIKGGLGMNEKGEVLIFDGVDTIYGVPFLSMDETYANGKEFLNGEGLTDEQKAAYHCD